MTGEPKTGDKLFELIKQAIKLLWEKYGVDTVAWACDDGPDGKKLEGLLASCFRPSLPLFAGLTR